jgi:hypothetical protein
MQELRPQPILDGAKALVVGIAKANERRDDLRRRRRPHHGLTSNQGAHSMANDYRKNRWYKHMTEIDREIARHAVNCKVPLLDPGVIERVLQNDSSVCGTQNPQSFAKLRSLLMMHYSVRDRAVVAIGQTETIAMVEDIVARLREHIGDKLGGAPPT